MPIIPKKNPIGNDPGHLLRSEKRINEQLKRMPPHRQENLKFLRDEVNNGKQLRLPTFKEDPFGEVEFIELSKRYEKIHGRGSLKKALEERFPGRRELRAQGESFAKRATESRSQENSGRGSK